MDEMTGRRARARIAEAIEGWGKHPEQSNVRYDMAQDVWRRCKEASVGCRVNSSVSNRCVYFFTEKLPLLWVKNLCFQSIEENLKSLKRGGGSAASQ